MDEKSTRILKCWRDELAELGKKHSVKSKTLDVWARYSKPFNYALGIIGGTSGTASLLSSFWTDDDFEIGSQQIISLIQSGLLIISSIITAQDFEMRSIKHNNTAGDVAEFVNEIDLLLNDQKLDEHDVIQAITRLALKKTKIQQNAPYL